MATKTKSKTSAKKTTTKRKATARKKPAAVVIVEAAEGGGFIWRALDADGKEVEVMNGVSRSRHFARRAGSTAYPHLPVQ